jgi:hypothetical protein
MCSHTPHSACSHISTESPILTIFSCRIPISKKLLYKTNNRSYMVSYTIRIYIIKYLKLLQEKIYITKSINKLTKSSGWTVQRLNACIWWQASCITGSRAGASPALPIAPPSTLPIRLLTSAVPAADTTCTLFIAPFEYLSLAPPLPDLRELLKNRRCGTPLEADR